MTTGLPRLAECRECTAPIRFVRMDQTGRPMPVDPAPSPEHGTIAARLRATPKGRALEGYVISSDRHGAPTHPYRFVPHYATCEARKPAPKKPVPAEEPLW